LESNSSEDDLEIVEQSELDHFVSVLQNAQKIAAKAEREQKPQKRPQKFDGKSERTRRRHKKRREDLAKQGFLSMFDFIAHSKEKACRKAQMEQLVAKTLESKRAKTVLEEESSESESDTEELMPEHMSQGRQVRQNVQTRQKND
jgi:hypothetical protein